MTRKPGFGRTLVWILGYLILIDIAVNVIFPFPKDPRITSPPEMARFFEYGRSVEGKLARMSRVTEGKSTAVLRTGWLEAPRVRTVSQGNAEAGRPTITVYGMSHSVQLANDMSRVDPAAPIRSFGAPGAVASWSYAAYLSDRRSYHSDIVILAVMTLGVPYICTTSGTTNHFDSVWPYTYPRFVLREGRLEVIDPPFQSLEDYRLCFFDQLKWQAYVTWLKENDRFFDPWLFEQTFLDTSSVFRMLRRAYAYSSRRRKEADIYDDITGFNMESEEVRLLLAIVEDFVEEARRDNSLPVLYVVNNLFSGKRLFDLLEETLNDHDIAYLSSHSVCDPDDPRNYLPDSHFKPAINLKIAREMMQLLKQSVRPGTS